MNSTICVDFGTSNSAAYILRNHVPEMLADVNGNYLFPSFVEYTNGSVVTGYGAKINLGRKNKYVISCVKRLIGLTYDEYCQLNERNIFGCSVVCGKDGFPEFVVDKAGNTKTCVEVASELFRAIKNRAELYCDPQKFDCMYLTYPVMFKDTQLQAIKLAAETAGLTVKKMINEPTAAALSWVLDNNDATKINEKLLVYDMGGGTFDVSFLSVISFSQYRIIDSFGDSTLGGNDVDIALAKFVCHTKNIDFNTLCRENPRRISALLRCCEDAKGVLQTNLNVDMDLSDVFEDDSSMNLSSAVLENIARSIINRTLDCIRKITDKPGQNIGYIRKVFFVGGSSKLKAVHSAVHNMFNHSEFPEIDPDHCVAKGAMKLLLMDNKEGNHDVIQFKMSNSYGMEVEGQKVAIFIKREDYIPMTTKEIRFKSTEDNQNHVDTNIYEYDGEIDNSLHDIPQIPIEKCTKVASLSFKFDNSEPKGKLFIGITFSMESGGILHVHCRNILTNDVMLDTTYVNII